jgi:hypothetical protein
MENYEMVDELEDGETAVTFGMEGETKIVSPSAARAPKDPESASAPPSDTRYSGTPDCRCANSPAVSAGLMSESRRWSHRGS